MSTYLERSVQSLECAKFLNKSRKNFVSVFHCSYYSVFQLAKHVLIEVLNRNEGSLKEEETVTKKRSHELYNYLIMKELRERDSEYAMDVNEKWNILKQYRIDADYRNTDFESHHFGLAVKIAEILTEQLTKNFGIK